MKKMLFVLLLCPVLFCGCKKDDYDPTNPFKNTTWKCELDSMVTLTLHFEEDTCTLKVEDGYYNISYLKGYSCYKDKKTTWDESNQRYSSVLVDCVKFDHFEINYTTHII